VIVYDTKGFGGISLTGAGATTTGANYTLTGAGGYAF